MEVALVWRSGGAMHQAKLAEREKVLMESSGQIAEHFPRKPQECRSHERGRCTKGEECPGSHDLPDELLACTEC